ncbi:glutaminase A [Gulosibacter bifidus]|uniref:Glutaminase n=1 Tax=Gulosibacter bifidus TaxID=272239 RepID=A0ABW5RFT0_9MICO|nr:glutaminase A [Gulosibacter bifidus]
MKTPIPEYLDEICRNARRDTSGSPAEYIPELANVDPEKTALALCTPAGKVYSTGDDEHLFTLQSASKPFIYAIALRDRGIDAIDDIIDVEPSGERFNDISVDPDNGRPRNPMINMGAITAHTLIGDPSMTPQERVDYAIACLSDFAGRDLDVNVKLRDSELTGRYRNLALAAMARSNNYITVEPEDAVWGYTTQCATQVTVRDLAVMAMTLANGGKNPITGKEVIPRQVCRRVLSVMATCGMYDAAGDWLTSAGLPAKSGVSGCIFGALPGQVGLSAFSPRLDEVGHSVRGIDMLEQCSQSMDLHLMALPAPSIDAIGSRTTSEQGSQVVEIQGALNFPTAELVLRRFEEIPASDCEVVVDLALVPRINDVGERMLREGIARLSRDGHAITLIDPHGRIPNPRSHDRAAIPVLEDVADYLEEDEYLEDNIDLITDTVADSATDSPTRAKNQADSTGEADA